MTTKHGTQWLTSQWSYASKMEAVITMWHHMQTLFWPVFYELLQLLYFFGGVRAWLWGRGLGGGGGGGQWTHRGGFQAVGGTYGASRLQADSTHERVVKKEDGERLAKVRLKHINASSTVRYCLTLSLCRVLVLSLCVSGTHQMFNRLFLHGSSPRRI